MTREDKEELIANVTKYTLKLSTTTTKMVKPLIYTRSSVLVPENILLNLITSTTIDTQAKPAENIRLKELFTHIIGELIDCLGYDANSSKYTIRLSPNVLIGCVIFITGVINPNYVEYSDSTDKDNLNLDIQDNMWVAAKENLIKKHPNFIDISKLTNEDIDILKEAYCGYFVYISMLLFRKSYFYRQIVKSRLLPMDESDIVEDETLLSFITSNNQKYFSTINIYQLSKAYSNALFLPEMLTMDCLLQTVILSQKSRPNIINVLESYFVLIDKMFIENNSIKYNLGSMKLAYGLATTFPALFSKVLPEYTFSVELSLPPILNQFYIVKCVVEKLKRIFNKQAGVGSTLTKILRELDNLFVSSNELMMLYHVGHLEYCGPGLGVKDIWPDILQFIATLGTALNNVTKTLNQMEATDINKDYEWLNYPLFKGVPINSLELVLYEKAMTTIYEAPQDNLIQLIKSSTSILASGSTIHITPLDLVNLDTKHSFQSLTN